MSASEGPSATFIRGIYGKGTCRSALNMIFCAKRLSLRRNGSRPAKRRRPRNTAIWEEWRESGRQIRLHTIAHLDYYLNLFADNARANGVHVHFADTASGSSCAYSAIARAKQAASVVKSKSMVTEELHLNQRLESIGVEAIETDLGEYIIQLAGETPSHIIIPAIHKNRYQIADCYLKMREKPWPPDTQFSPDLSAGS